MRPPRSPNAPPGSSGARVHCLALCAAVAAVLCAACSKTEAQWRRELADPDPFVRGLAAIALGERDPEHAGDALAVLIQTTAGDKTALRSPAWRALARVAGKNVAETLELLRADLGLMPEARRFILDALVVAGEGAIAPILDAMREPGASNPRELGLLLVRMGDPAVEPLIAQLREGQERERVWAAWLLGQLGPRAVSALPELLAAVDGGRPRVARAAIEGLQRVEPTAAVGMPSFYLALESPDADVREAATLAIARVHLARAARLGERDRPNAVRAVLALGERAWPELIDAVLDPEPGTQALALACLTTIGASIEIGAKRARTDPAWSGSDGGEGKNLPLRALHEPTAVRGVTALRFARLGREARPALPLLAFVAGDSHLGVRLCANWAIWCIVLDASGEALRAGSRSVR